MEKHTVPTEQIPYEIRRNPLQISLYKQSAIKDHKLLIHPSHQIDKSLQPFVSKTDDIPITQNDIHPQYTYVYRTMSLDNHGHFIIDNLIPLYKMIVLTQGYEFRRENVLFCFLKAPKETVKQQTLNKKQIQLLSAFSSHPIRFIQQIPDQPIPNLVVPFLGLGQSLAFMKWRQYQPLQYNEYISIEFLENFRERILLYFNIEQLPPTQTTQIFLSRRGAKHRRVLNEEETINDMNLTSVLFNDKSIEEELSIFHCADLVVTPYGAGIVGCFFMRPNSKCIIIHPKGFGEQFDFPQIYVFFLKRLGIDVHVFHNPLGRDLKNIFRNRDSHITVDINELKLQPYMN